jgi:hypothetical protein
VHRFASRTTLLEAALDDLLFKGASLTDLPAQPHLVINATELRTGSAFRFGTMESGSWRWGKLHRNGDARAAANASDPLFAVSRAISSARRVAARPPPHSTACPGAKPPSLCLRE